MADKPASDKASANGWKLALMIIVPIATLSAGWMGSNSFNLRQADVEREGIRQRVVALEHAVAEIKSDTKQTREAVLRYLGPDSKRSSP
jgi:hypothetical protein